MQAVSNFLALCRGVEVGGVRLCYAGCPFTRIMERFLLQAGDVVNRDGTGARWGVVGGWGGAELRERAMVEVAAAAAAYACMLLPLVA